MLVVAEQPWSLARYLPQGTRVPAASNKPFVSSPPRCKHPAPRRAAGPGRAVAGNRGAASPGLAGAAPWGGGRRRGHNEDQAPACTPARRHPPRLGSARLGAVARTLGARGTAGAALPRPPRVAGQLLLAPLGEGPPRSRLRACAAPAPGGVPAAAGRGGAGRRSPPGQWQRARRGAALSGAEVSPARQRLGGGVPGSPPRGPGRAQGSAERCPGPGAAAHVRPGGGGKAPAGGGGSPGEGGRDGPVASSRGMPRARPARPGPAPPAPTPSPGQRGGCG